jgi:hypothetical protein
MKHAWLVALGGAAVATTAVLAVRGSQLVLTLDEDIPVRLRGSVPLRAKIAQRVDVQVEEELTATVKLGRMEIPIDETFQVPLDFRLSVPIDTAMHVDQMIDVAMTVPVDVVLTERELDLRKLEIPIDTELFIDDQIPIELEIPIDTEVETTLGIKVPVKARIPVKVLVPIRQKVRVRDTLRVGVPKLRVPLHMQVPVKAQVPIKQAVRVTGQVDVPVKQKINVPVRKVMRPDLGDEVVAQVKLLGKLPAELAGDIDTKITMDHAVPTRIGEIRLDVGSVSIERRDAPP